MKFPWANTLLLTLLLTDIVSGFFGLVSGSPDRAVFIVVHRVAGWGIVVVMGWKLVNIARSLKWPRYRSHRVASLSLLVLLVATLALGFAWSFAGPMQLWIFSGVSWHINLGVVLGLLLVWHVVQFTWRMPRSFWIERRTFLRAAAIGIAGVAVWQISESIIRLANLSGAKRRFTGSYEATSFSGNTFPTTSWIDDNPLPVVLDSWSLEVSGTVDIPKSFKYSDLGRDTEVVETIDCTGGWFSTQEWSGMSLQEILNQVAVRESASSVTVTSITGYYRRFSMSEAKDYTLATHVGDEVLSHGHGFPVRLVAPGKRGFEWVKWVTRIEVNESPDWLQPPLPIQ